MASPAELTKALSNSKKEHAQSKAARMLYKTLLGFRYNQNQDRNKSGFANHGIAHGEPNKANTPPINANAPSGHCPSSPQKAVCVSENRYKEILSRSTQCFLMNRIIWFNLW